jgi:uncharacterized protein YndB with AHSA1/START domain
MTQTPPPDRRSIELEVEVSGSTEEVWRAIATGPGITSWYVPHTVEERQGGEASASFGPGMDVNGRVVDWEPPRRVVFDGGEHDDGLAFEWLIEAKDGGSCIVRLVNSGFLVGDEWDDFYDAMTEGWGIFLANLQLHLAHFPGQSAAASLPLATWAGPRDDAWSRMLTGLGLNPLGTVGERISVEGADAPSLGGTVAAISSHRISMVVDDPAPGTAFIAAEGRGDDVEVSIWTYLYGEAGAVASERDDPRWREWLSSRGIAR